MGFWVLDFLYEKYQYDLLNRFVLIMQLVEALYKKKLNVSRIVFTFSFISTNIYRDMR